MQQNPVVMSAVAVLDLQGFANHLELASLDPRTELGNIAIRRLGLLEEVVTLIKDEQKQFPDEFPEFSVLRINDMLVLAADLPDFFLPKTGGTESEGYSISELMTMFSEKAWKDEEELKKEHAELMVKHATPLALFVGSVSRIYFAIAGKERDQSYPGVKGAISMGLRRRLEKPADDPFSLNLAFSYSYLASNQLKGAELFVDSQVVRALSWDMQARWLVWNALHVSEELPYLPKPPTFDAEFPVTPRERRIPPADTLTLLRRKKFYYRVNRSLCQLQFLRALNAGKITGKVADFLGDHIKPKFNKDGTYAFHELAMVATDLFHGPLKSFIAMRPS